MKLFGESEGELYDEPFDVQEEEARQNPMYAEVDLADFGDRLPAGYGPFGSITNPIPVNGIAGERIYLNRLRSDNDQGFYFHRPGCSTSDVSPHPVDGFELYSVDGQVRITVWLSPYHRRRSKLAPEGCFLRPFPQTEAEQILVRVPGYGSMSRVHAFPHDLPETIATSDKLNEIIPGLGQSMARYVREGLSRLRLPERYQGIRSKAELSGGPIERAWGVFIQDGEGATVDFGIFRHKYSFAELKSILESAEAKGIQALLMVAMLDERNLSHDERTDLAGEFGLDPADLATFSVHFAWRWLLHELQDRPLEGGAFGPRVACRPVVHWADLPHLPQPMSRKCRGILNDLVPRRQ